jgi:FkbM family methyltransferase
VTLVEWTLLPIFRRIEFRGKRRIYHYLRVPSHGTREVSLCGARFRLRLEEPLQRDYYAGVYDRSELGTVRAGLPPNGDFVDVGAHIGLYTVVAARAAAAAGGRVLAFEPHPESRRQLLENLALNHCTNVDVVAAAAADHSSSALLRMSRHGDASWSTLEVEPSFGDADVVEVETTTVDAEVERHGLRPAFVKVDVEGAEERVLAGMTKTLALRPRLLIELSPATAGAVHATLAPLGYGVTTFVGLRRLAGLHVDGLCNVLFTAAPDL